METDKKREDELISRTDLRLLARAKECWDFLKDFRRERERCKNFTYGDQWNDFIEDRGVRMRERDYIVSQGNMPLKNNLIRRLVRNVLGVYRNRWKMPRCERVGSGDGREIVAVNGMLEYISDINRLEEVYARTMEEFLISGLAVHKKWYGRRNGNCDCQTDLISPSRFFFDRCSSDFRGFDVSIVGEIHELAVNDLVATFARNPREAETVRTVYGLPPSGQTDVFCAVYEVWERHRPMMLRCHDRREGSLYTLGAADEKKIAAENMRRRLKGEKRLIETVWTTEEEWHYAFLTPDGHVLREGRSPYPDGSHPYIIKAYPYIDGEIHSFVSDIIDQQKLTNRLISMYDWILRASAKGVLLFPEGSLPDGVDINEIADEWGRFNGVIVYRPRAGVPLPQQVSSKSADIGITELLEIQMKMMEDISGVNGALQGKLESNSMSGTLYNQQTQNSLTALADLLRSFDDFVMQATHADVANMLRFYTRDVIRDITGESVGNGFNQLNAKNVLKLTNQ